jgi:hypothetical protein
MNDRTKIPASDEAWDEGVLGQADEFAHSAPEDAALEAALDQALDLQMISIRLQKSLIEDLKSIAKLNGLGYQPLIRQTLTRFIDCEKKRLLREAAATMESRIRKDREGTKSRAAHRKRA